MSADNFAMRLRELRKERGWTQPELADKAGLTRDGVAHLEQGRRKPTWETVVALAAALGVTPNDFLEAPADGPGREGRRRRKQGG
jgi:transcriptional regulator with XRE-family HTH domain